MYIILFLYIVVVYLILLSKVFSIHVEKIQDWIQHCIVEAIYTQDPKQQTI